MITILPDNNYTECGLIGGRYADNVFVFTARDGEECLGFGAVEMNDTYAEIVDVTTLPGMESLEHGIFKALLNFVERRSVYDCVCALDKPAMLKRLGFAPAEKEWVDVVGDSDVVFYLNLTGYFDKHC